MTKRNWQKLVIVQGLNHVNTLFTTAGKDYSRGACAKSQIQAMADHIMTSLMQTEAV